MTSLGLIPEILARVLRAGPPHAPLWLVGGAVRDHFLSRITTDFDLVYRGDSLRLARQLADTHSGSYYTLDDERETGRVLLELNGQALRIDIARLTGADILDDLARRDFTVNAMAVAWERPNDLIDPHHGLADLKARILKTCSSDSIASDPVRAIRAVRLAAELELRMASETSSQIRAAAGGLGIVSGERRRDELFRILQLDDPAAPLRVLNHLQLLRQVVSVPGGAKSPAFETSIRLADSANYLVGLLAQEHDPDAPGKFGMAEASMRLGRFRKHLMAHFEEELSGGRSRRQLLLLAALLNQPEASIDQQSAPAGKIGWVVPGQIAKTLGLSAREATYLSHAIEGRRTLADRGGSRLAPPDIYRYFKELGSDGIGACLLWLAEGIGPSGGAPAQDDWAERVETARQLLGAYFDGEGVRIGSPGLLTGDELMDELGLDEGPLVGALLEALQEALAIGAISNRDQALAMARELLPELQESTDQNGAGQG